MLISLSLLNCPVTKNPVLLTMFLSPKAFAGLNFRDTLFVSPTDSAEDVKCVCVWKNYKLRCSQILWEFAYVKNKFKYNY